MNPHLAFAFVAIVLPFAAADYGHASYGGGLDYLQPGSNHGVEDIINSAAGNYHSGGSLTAAADVGNEPAAQAGLAQANAQLHALNANPTYQHLKNSDTIAESLAQNNLAANIRQGNINVVPPNVVGQTAFRSLLVPHNLNNHQVIATQPMQPIVVNQPGAPPAHISSGPAAVVRAAPVVYKLKPSIIYQQEIINKVPAPLSLNPVYVKVYKPGKQVDAPISGSVASVAANEGSFAGSQFDGASQFAGQQGAYGAQPAY